MHTLRLFTNVRRSLAHTVTHALLALLTFALLACERAPSPSSVPPPKKQFKLHAEDVKKLIKPMGGGFATDHITVQGLPVGYMYREAAYNKVDSGWRFISGTESQTYLDDATNTSIYDVNTIANYDPAIIPYLGSPVGTQLERIPGTSTFRDAK